MASSGFANGVRRKTLIEHPNSSPELFDVETQMRECAPALPMALKSRTLTHCAQRASAQQQKQNRLHWRLTWAVAGVLTMQWLTVCVVDAQNTHLIAGNSGPPLLASVSISQINQLWHQRSRQLAQLMEPSQLG